MSIVFYTIFTPAKSDYEGHCDDIQYIDIRRPSAVLFLTLRCTNLKLEMYSSFHLSHSIKN